MSVKLLVENLLEDLSLKGGCTGSSESTLVKMSNCWKSHATAHYYLCTGTEVKWRTCVKRMRLMPNPHVEAGAQDYFLITRKNVSVV